MANTTGLIVQGFYHLDDVLMRGEDVEGLYFLQFLHFFERVELFFHAFYGDVFARLEGQGCKDN